MEGGVGVSGLESEVNAENFESAGLSLGLFAAALRSESAAPTYGVEEGLDECLDFEVDGVLPPVHLFI